VLRKQRGIRDLQCARRGTVIKQHEGGEKEHDMNRPPPWTIRGTGTLALKRTLNSILVRIDRGYSTNRRKYLEILRQSPLNGGRGMNAVIPKLKVNSVSLKFSEHE
jgi:hypothetical protein